MAISNVMTVVGLVNGMIGGVILVLPLLALKTGTLIILPITIFTGFVSYYTCLLCIRHLRNFKNLDAAIYHHFGKKISYKIFYDIIIIVSMTTLLVLYFSLICEQWSGIIGESKVISIVNAVILFPIVYVMKKYDFGATLLAYGILSVVGIFYLK
jgi:amino acid permease